MNGNYQVFTSTEFGNMLQNNNQQIVSISWETEETISPSFYFFNSVDSVIEYFKIYNQPFRIITEDSYEDCFTKENAIISFNDHSQIISVTYYKTNTMKYQFFNEVNYQAIKNRLSQ